MKEEQANCHSCAIYIGFVYLYMHSSESVSIKSVLCASRLFPVIIIILKSQQIQIYLCVCTFTTMPSSIDLYFQRLFCVPCRITGMTTTMMKNIIFVFTISCSCLCRCTRVSSKRHRHDSSMMIPFLLVLFFVWCNINFFFVWFEKMMNYVSVKRNFINST